MSDGYFSDVTRYNGNVTNSLQFTVSKISKNIMKTGLVTGAASGLGFEFSNLLAQDSFDLVLIDVDEPKLMAVK